MCRSPAATSTTAATPGTAIGVVEYVTPAGSGGRPQHHTRPRCTAHA
ncbi:MAG: hypothetical protein IPO88_02975 [Nannocystis sp.]|nr:hypothetical protein [Nannocystis sp.]MBK9752466.1 hypothetical protein [Nannocystis sp.]